MSSSNWNCPLLDDFRLPPASSFRLVVASAGPVRSGMARHSWLRALRRAICTLGPSIDKSNGNICFWALHRVYCLRDVNMSAFALRVFRARPDDSSHVRRTDRSDRRSLWKNSRLISDRALPFLQATLLLPFSWNSIRIKPFSLFIQTNSSGGKYRLFSYYQ